MWRVADVDAGYIAHMEDVPALLRETQQSHEPLIS